MVKCASLKIGSTKLYYLFNYFIKKLNNNYDIATHFTPTFEEI